MTLLTSAPVPIDSILPATRWSLHQDVSTESNEELIGSIAHLGLLRPPIVRLGQEGYELICGARRLDALRRLNHSPSISCSVLTSQSQKHDVLFLVAEDQRQTGPLSPIETARLLSFINESSDQPTHELLRLAATTSTSTTQRNRLVTLLQLEEVIRTSIHNGKISTKTGLNFVSLPSAERLFLHDLFIRLSLNGNKQHRFWELIQIIIGAEGSTIEEYFNNHFPELCKDPVDNPPQQTNRLLKLLYERSHPGISKAKEEFSKQLSEMNLPMNCKVSPSPAFERDRVTLEMEFDDFKTFSDFWHKMKKYG